MEDLFLGSQWSIILGYRRLSVKFLFFFTHSLFLFLFLTGTNFPPRLLPTSLSCTSWSNIWFKRFLSGQETIKRRKLRLSSCLVPINFQPFFSLCVILLMHHFLPFLVQFSFLGGNTGREWEGTVSLVQTWRMVEIYREISSGIHPSLLFIVVSGQIWDLQPNLPFSSVFF